jgi:hypothetical protein
LPVVLTLDAARDDFDVRVQQGVTALRRTRVLRLTTEAREQGGLLSCEDLAYRLLNCGVRTIVRDVEHLRKQNIAVPTRGQQQDIGPGQTHRVAAVRLFLDGLEPREIGRRLYHSLSSIENYVTTFGRVALLANKGYGDDEIAFIIRRSSSLVAGYRTLYAEFAKKRSARSRLNEIFTQVDAAAKGPTPRPTARRSGRRSASAPNTAPWARRSSRKPPRMRSMAWDLRAIPAVWRRLKKAY